MDKLCELIKQANDILLINNPVQIINDLNNIIKNLSDDNQKISSNLKMIDSKYLEQIDKLKSELEEKMIEIKQKNEELKNFAKFSIIQKVNKQLEEKNNYIQILELQIDKLKNKQPLSPKINEILLEEKIQLKSKHQPIVISHIPVDSMSPVNSPPPIEPHIVKPQLVELLSPPVKSHPNKLLQVESHPIEEQSVEQQVNITKKSTEKHIKKSKEINNDIINIDNFIEINGFELMMYKKKYYIRDLETNQLYDIQNNKQNKVVGIYNTITNKIKLQIT